MRRWACEGLSYLTLDADVKEMLIADTQALRSMVELAKVNFYSSVMQMFGEKKFSLIIICFIYLLCTVLYVITS